MPFSITCAACHKIFSIADDVFERKVKGRVVTIKCKQCQSGIRVDGTKETPVFSVADSVRSPPVAPVDMPAAPGDPVIARAPAVASPGAGAEVGAKTAAAHASAESKFPAIQPLTAKAPQAAKEVPRAAPAFQTTRLAGAPKETSPTVAAQARVTAMAARVTPAPAGAATGALAARTTPTAKAGPLATAPKAQAAGSPALLGLKASLGAADGPENALTPKAPPVVPGLKAPPVVPGLKAPPVVPGLKAPPVVPGLKAPPVAAAEPASTAQNEPPARAQAAPLPAFDVKPPPAPPASPVENLWAVDYPDGVDRELTLSEIETELAAGAINLSTLVWREGMAEWLELGQLPELRALPAATRPAFGADLPVTLPQLTDGQQRPPAPSAPVIDFARHDALRAPPPAPIPKLAASFSAGRDSRPPTPPAYMPGVPASPPSALPTFPTALPTVAAPFVAAATLRPSPSGAAPIVNVEDWSQKSRAPWAIGGLALLAVGGLIFFLTRSSADELAPAIAISALPATVPSTPQTSAQPEPAATPDPAAAGERSPSSNAALQPPGSAPVASPNAGFAELFASGARGADEKHGATRPAQRFDPAAAKAALAATANATAACREKGGPAGIATVVVTFDPSGKVASATVSDAPFAGTSSGACIAATMKRATVPAFSGPPGTLTKIISIQ